MQTASACLHAGCTKQCPKDSRQIRSGHWPKLLMSANNIARVAIILPEQGYDIGVDRSIEWLSKSWKGAGVDVCCEDDLRSEVPRHSEAVTMMASSTTQGAFMDFLSLAGSQHHVPGRSGTLQPSKVSFKTRDNLPVCQLRTRTLDLPGISLKKCLNLHRRTSMLCNMHFASVTEAADYQLFNHWLDYRAFYQKSMSYLSHRH
ncbi:predicted protein [Histoplasma capsulatum var. duboisii H88]|uniref:Predicted protein n=1 Tax=Ajellomyces capsulatus (strain H88) TaxID=544711 RepID=F0U508_AJEC8|nr:predicted protein [Histoplasma capsulatum var. duboisii H88]